jgi:hypothetical protein
MASQYLIERDRGNKEASQQLAVLRERRPLAFPVKDQDVRQLAIAAASEIAAVMDWLLPYTLGVLGRWKMASVYCQAVLCHETNASRLTAQAEASMRRRGTWQQSGRSSSRRAKLQRRPRRLRRPPR